ncbi:hypothetical protein ACFL4X_00410 [Gemmatimonadota bacterium]
MKYLSKKNLSSAEWILFRKISRNLLGLTTEQRKEVRDSFFYIPISSHQKSQKRRQRFDPENVDAFLDVVNHIVYYERIAFLSGMTVGNILKRKDSGSVIYQINMAIESINRAIDHLRLAEEREKDIWLDQHRPVLAQLPPDDPFVEYCKKQKKPEISIFNASNELKILLNLRDKIKTMLPNPSDRRVKSRPIAIYLLVRSLIIEFEFFFGILPSKSKTSPFVTVCQVAFSAMGHPLSEESASLIIRIMLSEPPIYREISAPLWSEIEQLASTDG